MSSEFQKLERASKQLKVKPTLHRQNAPLASSSAQIELLNSLAIDAPYAGDFEAQLAANGQDTLLATGIDVFQVNLGRLCNQTCSHCHVDAGPDRHEDMSLSTAEACMRALAKTSIPTVDITGGAPEMSASFRYIVEEATRLGRHVIDRCNLTILGVKRYADLPEFLAEHRVEVVSSLPHYRSAMTDRQRGDGVFEASIAALRRLNALGYGIDESLRLVLVTNPVGAFLPAGQASLEAEWKRELRRLYGIEFNALFTITNLPISRYLEWLQSSGNLEEYMQTLVDAFNPAAAREVMCRNTISVGWQGELYDCDFNQMLELEVGYGSPRHIADFDFEALAKRRIVTGRHCYACTAGAGSSCGGSLD